MSPFPPPELVLSGFKERLDALTIHGDRLYIGSGAGNLHIYSVEGTADETQLNNATLVETRKGLTRRAISQIGFIKDINSLVVLSESVVTLFPLPGLAPPTPLVKAKGAFSLATHTSIQHLLPDGTAAEPTADFTLTAVKPIPTLITHLVVGCQRKVVVYSWKDGEPQDPTELPLPHSPRTITFIDLDTVCFAYPTDYAIFSLKSLIVTDVIIPLAPSVSSSSGAFTGLTGYMTLGLGGGAKKAGVIKVGKDQVVIGKEHQGIFIGLDGKQSRPDTIEWPAPPEEIAFLEPYILAVLPPGTVPSLAATATAPTFIQNTTIQIRSSLSLLPVQTVTYPFAAPSTVSNATVRLISIQNNGSAKLFAVTTPTDKTLAAEGISIWRFRMKEWAEQLDELVASGQYAEALALLSTLDEKSLPDKEQRKTKIRGLNALAQFKAEKYDAAINEFLELDLNPAKVVALFPAEVAGRLTVPAEGWVELFGGPKAPSRAPTVVGHSEGEEGSEHVEETTDTTGVESNLASSSTLTDVRAAEGKESPERSSTTDLLDSILSSPASVGGSIRGTLKKTGLGGLGAFIPYTSPNRDKDKDEPSSETASLVGGGKAKRATPGVNSSIVSLMHYLPERRRKLTGALEKLHITPADSPQTAFLSETSVEDLFALPDAPLSSLAPDQLIRFAQIVDTALFKSYLLARPGLLASLCRQPNWCEVAEVEVELKERAKFSELIYLYNGKKMHSKALDLLKQLSEKEEDVEDKLTPSITYLQKLGPEHLSQIFETSRWIFAQDPDMALQIFTSEEAELPRQAVANHLESIDPQICARYLEYLIEEREELSVGFHDRLAELYLSMTLTARKRGDTKLSQDVYAKLLHFIDTNKQYRIDSLYGRLSSEDLYEARAILLGRLGRHDQALELYAYRLQDYIKAEEYCKRVYQPNTPNSGVFLTLLRIYLRPTVQTLDLLGPALDLISRHSPRLDAIDTLQLLPPLVTAQSIGTFLIEALRTPKFDASVIREIGKSHNDQVSRKLMLLESKRVKVTDSRICPQCHKRIGGSMIAVHALRGEVTHYNCRELFSKKLADMRI